MNEKRWRRGYLSGWCHGSGRHDWCRDDGSVCHCPCHRARLNGQAPRQAP